MGGYLPNCWGYVDFELDDLVALEARAEAEWARARAGGGEARVVIVP